MRLFRPGGSSVGLLRQASRVLEGVDGLDTLVAPDRFNPRKTQCQTAGVARARLDRVESHLQHDIRFYDSITAPLADGVLLEMLR